MYARTFASSKPTVLTQQEQQLQGIAFSHDDDGVETVLQIATAFLSTSDRRVVRTEGMNQRMLAAAGSRAPRGEN
jgi:hypothetical protein